MTTTDPPVRPNTHKKVTMRNVIYAKRGARYEITNEATDYLLNADVNDYVDDAKTRWMEVIVTNVNAKVPPVSPPGKR